MDRQYDLLVLQPPSISGQPTRPTFLDVAGSAKLCTGLAKLAQRFTILFLTRLGSVRYDPTRGTEFVTAAVSGRIRHETDAKAEFNFSTMRIKQQLADLYNNADVSADEKLETATLDSVSIAEDTIDLEITITSQAGNFARFVVPVDKLS